MLFVLGNIQFEVTGTSHIKDEFLNEKMERWLICM